MGVTGGVCVHVTGCIEVVASVDMETMYVALTEEGLAGWSELMGSYPFLLVGVAGGVCDYVTGCTEVVALVGMATVAVERLSVWSELVGGYPMEGDRFVAMAAVVVEKG